MNIKRGKCFNIGESIAGIEELKCLETYKYLGVIQNNIIDHTQQKGQFLELYRKRVTKILNSKLSRKNSIIAIKTWAVPILTYSFGTLKWSNADLNELDRTTRRLLTKFRRLHPSSSATRLYTPRIEGGRGLLNILNLCRSQEFKIKNRLLACEESLMTSVREADQKFTPLNPSEHDNATPISELDVWRDRVFYMANFL